MSGAAFVCGKNPMQASKPVASIVTMFRFFIDLVCSFIFGLCDFPGRVARHSQGGSGTILISSSLLLISVSKGFAKNADGCQSKKEGDR